MLTPQERARIEARYAEYLDLPEGPARSTRARKDPYRLEFNPELERLIEQYHVWDAACQRLPVANPNFAVVCRERDRLHERIGQKLRGSRWYTARDGRRYGYSRAEESLFVLPPLDRHKVDRSEFPPGVRKQVYDCADEAERRRLEAESLAATDRQAIRHERGRDG